MTDPHTDRPTRAAEPRTTPDESVVRTDGGSPEDPPADPSTSDGNSGDDPTPSAGGSGDDPTDDEVEPDEILEGIERKRSLSGWATIAVSLIGITFSLFQIWLAARGFVFEFSIPFYGELRLAALQLLQVNAIHVAFALVLAFLMFPPSTGDGAVARRLGRIVPAIESAFGADHPVTRMAAAVRRGVRWLFLDPERDRVTPVDLVFAGLSVLTAAYMVLDFKEIQNLRVFGLEAGRTIPEVYPFLAGPLDLLSATGIPLNEISYAFFLGAVGTLLVLEATRRSLGLYLMLIVASFIVYARWGFLITPQTPLIGVLSIPQGSWANIVQNLWYNTENGVFGIPVTVSVQFIYIFILFGSFLEMSGAGQWFIDLAYSITGMRKGGPAKASILASGFMGTISGSSIANTVTTGAFTIPLMKRSGYRAEFAGAVEASASSGGQILPPVMGAAAFLMIEFIGVPFQDIIIAATVPAIVFFFGVWVMVHLEASRAGIGGLSREDVVDIRSHIRRGWFYLVPIILLLFYLLVERLTVARSAWFTLVAFMALLAVVAAYNERSRVPLIGTITVLFLAEFGAFLTAGVDVIGLLMGATGEPLAPMAAFAAAGGSLGTIVILISVAFMLARPGGDAPLLDFDDPVDRAAERVASAIRRPSLGTSRPFQYGSFLGKSLDAGARTATEVVIAVAAAGIIPGVVSATGLGPNLTALIKAVAGGSIVLLLLFTAIASIILGMGMPTTVTYIILVSLLGPAIAQSSTIPLLAAHMFILYFGVIADITPPVAVAAYAASGVAKSDPFRTGTKAFSLSLNKAIVPFAFALTPGILLLRGEGTAFRVLTLDDVAQLGYFIPEVLLPIIGVFAGVVALGATVIGYFYAPVDRRDRALFAVSAFLLMAPLLVLNASTDVLGFVGIVQNVGEPLVIDIGLRVTGAILFGALTLKNRAASNREPPTTTTRAEPTD